MRRFFQATSLPVCILLGSAVITNASPAFNPTLSCQSFSLPPLSGKNGGVATDVAQCSDISVDTMKVGGNAADAILASGLCVGTIASYHLGIGGGGFMLVCFNKGCWSIFNLRYVPTETSDSVTDTKSDFRFTLFSIWIYQCVSSSYLKLKLNS
jgi:hypothetical protein